MFERYLSRSGAFTNTHTNVHWQRGKVISVRPNDIVVRQHPAVSKRWYRIVWFSFLLFRVSCEFWLAAGWSGGDASRRYQTQPTEWNAKLTLVNSAPTSISIIQRRMCVSGSSPSLPLWFMGECRAIRDLFLLVVQPTFWKLLFFSHLTLFVSLPVPLPPTLSCHAAIAIWEASRKHREKLHNFQMLRLAYAFNKVINFWCDPLRFHSSPFTAGGSETNEWWNWIFRWIVDGFPSRNIPQRSELILLVSGDG